MEDHKVNGDPYNELGIDNNLRTQVLASFQLAPFNFEDDASKTQWDICVAYLREFLETVTLANGKYIAYHQDEEYYVHWTVSANSHKVFVDAVHVKCSAEETPTHVNILMQNK